MDLVFGIPSSSDIDAGYMKEIKYFFRKLASLFKITNRDAHIGIISYSDTASMQLKLDSVYQLSQINKFIKEMEPTGKSFYSGFVWVTTNFEFLNFSVGEFDQSQTKTKTLQI